MKDNLGCWTHLCLVLKFPLHSQKKGTSSCMGWIPHAVVPAAPQTRGDHEHSRKSSGRDSLQHVSDGIPLDQQPVNVSMYCCDS